MYISRRSFLKGAAGVGLATAAATTFYIKNKSPEEISDLLANAVESGVDVLIVGGGIAGVMAAVRAKRAGANVVLVDKGSVGRSGQTPFANGFRVFDESAGDDRETWVKDWATVTGGIHHDAYLDNFLDYSKDIYEELESWGATGVGFGAVLRSQLQTEGIQVIERTMLTTLVEEEGQIAGAIGFSLDTEEALVINAKAVVLCTGAGAFKPNGFQVCSLTHDGDAMAYRVGGEISGKEYVDTHFTGSTNPAYCWGNWESMWETGMMKESGGPEVGGGGLDLSMYHMAHAGSIPATLGGMDKGEKPADLEENGAAEGDERPSGPPGGDSGGGAPGSGEGDQIGGASGGLGVHKSEGLFPADGTCGTNIVGLFAAGDCLSSMLAGTKYCGVNGVSLASSATQGALAGETAAAFIEENDLLTISEERLTALKEAMFLPRTLTEGYSPSWVTQMLKFNTLPYYVLYIKKEDRLQAALSNIMFLKEKYGDKMVASDAHELRLVHETRNMLLNAEMKLRASLFRTESRGNHYREDYPETNDGDWLAWVVIKQDSDGNMALSKVSAV